MMSFFRRKETQRAPFPGIRTAQSGRAAAIVWTKDGAPSVARLAGIAMTGARASAWIDGETLLAEFGMLREAAARHIPFVLHLERGAASSGGLSDFPAFDDAGCFLMHARSAQEAADFSLIAHRIAERALVPGVVIQDAPLTTQTTASILRPEDDLVKEYLGSADDLVAAPTGAQKILFGGRRRRIPELWSVDRPLVAPSSYGEDSLGESRVGGRLFFLDHVAGIADEAMRRFEELTGRGYDRAAAVLNGDAEYTILCTGAETGTAEAAAADFSRKRCGMGLVSLSMLRPFPAEDLRRLLAGRKGILVLENRDAALAEDPPLTRETRAALGASCPPLYTAVHGLGGSALRPGELYPALENILAQGSRRRSVYLSLSQPAPRSPKQEIEQQAVLDAYPEAAERMPAPAPAADLLPAGAFTIRLLGAAPALRDAAGERLGALLAELFEHRLRAHAEPESGSYRITVAHEEIRTAAAPAAADIAIILDPALLRGGALDGVRKSGCVILQSVADKPEHVRDALPPRALRTARDRMLRLFAADIRALSSMQNPEELAYVLLGCATAAMNSLVYAAPPEARLKETLRQPLVKRGHNALIELGEIPGAASAPETGKEPELPLRLNTHPCADVPVADIHRFYAQTGHRYAADSGGNPVDPFLASGHAPAATGILRSHSAERDSYPRLNPEKCSGCGDCWLACPDAALPARVNDFSEICECAISQLETEGHKIEHLPTTLRQVQAEYEALAGDLPAGRSFQELLRRAIERTATASRLAGGARAEFEAELALFQDKLKNFPAAMTEPFYAQGGGGLLSIAVDADACRGCLSCVAVCRENALVPAKQTPAADMELRRSFAFAQSLPGTDTRHILSVDTEGDAKGAATLLLDARAHGATVGGGGGEAGAGERTALRLFAAATTATLRQRLNRKAAVLKGLIERLENHIRLGLSVDIQDPSALADILKDPEGGAVTLAEISARLDRENKPLDKEWLKRVTGALAELKSWRARIITGGTARADFGAVLVGAGQLARYPYNPFAFPCARVDKNGGVDLALGLFTGHMRKMAAGIKACRIAELELDGKYKPKIHDEVFRRFDWRSFSDDERRLCPPVAVFGAARDLFGPAFQSLSAALSSGCPIKIIAFAAAGDLPENALIAAAHPEIYVLQSGIADPVHLINGFIAGISSRRPALFQVFAGGAGDTAARQARGARDARALPYLRYDPEQGAGDDERLDLSGNPELEADWTTRKLHHIDEEGRPATLDIPYTFADYAATEPAFRDEFVEVPPRSWGSDMVPVADYLEMDADERAEAVAFVWAVDWSGTLKRLKVSAAILRTCERRLVFWRGLKRRKRLDIATVDENVIAEKARGEMVEKLTQSLMELAQSGRSG
ncbi:MAG: 4Fe-4S binding protein [Elusimicrobiota bacterium]